MLTGLRSAITSNLRRVTEQVTRGALPLELPPARLPLLSFSATGLERWSLHTDASIGGFSECTLTQQSAVSALWSGSTALEADPKRQEGAPKSDQGKSVSRTGFVAMRSPCTGPSDQEWSLHDFHGLCLRARVDHRRYVLNVRAEGVLGDSRTDDLYQAMLHPFVPHAQPVTTWEADIGTDGRDGAERSDGEASSGPIIDVRVPWGAFTLTWRGYVQGVRPPAMNLDRVTHVGLLLADSTEGDFAIELGGVAAFRYGEEEQLHSPHVREVLRLNEAAGYEDATTG
jgi:hypothetical protein